jgi:crotonobetainyl-CoA:carnitine CoA-transferase CaiB-like acyl-CoA transferase
MVFADEQVRHRGLLKDLPHALAGTVPLVTSPIRLANAPLAVNRPPPLLGEHTDEVFRELGLMT